MTIQWFPGHMAKARNQVQEKLKLVDIVLEIVDARIPESSRNPMMDEIIADKPRLLVLNKADLADKKQTAAWLDYYQKHDLPAIAIDAQHKSRLPQIEKTVRQILATKITRQQAKGLKIVKLRAMCIGIPNVGKSTVLNRLVQKNIAKTGNKPGVTKNQQWLKVSDSFEVLDTPGILWPKFEDPDTGMKLALLGSIKDSIFHADDVALFGLDLLRQRYQAQLQQTYHLQAADFERDNAGLLLTLTKKNGFKDDYDQFSEKMINDLRKGRFGGVTLDVIPTPTSETEVPTDD
ncbi:ribosome biogenesis GTPase YlqF [Agrilactobacillus fermenti]|uniref:ribosome biogenesis GTPase YlqF n=1 Tax=Agrilactobacillus fermenti TaxID=2586909 RepID=UPI001E3BF8B9|nr:ribosome biogenesis GTPase YlqF [Agrilactobacillus fermenti]MCD2256553.1 ribosome biogenesis GTPase YlqF [Agrilactobacillus fermenti]